MPIDERITSEAHAPGSWNAVELPKAAWLAGPATVLAAVLSPLFRRATHGSFWKVAAAIVAADVVFVILGFALHALGLKRGAVVLYLVGVTARVAYLFVTPFSVRSHDADQHIDYVEFIANHLAIPRPSAGWAFYHPPLYFALAASLWRILALCGASRAAIMVGLQVQSLVYQLGFLVFGLLTGQRWLDRVPDARFVGAAGGAGARRRLGLLFAALLCGWPSGILHAVRVGNDDLFYLFFGGGLYYLTRWWQDDRDRDLYVAGAFGAVAMQAKSNGLLLFVVLAVLLAVRAVRGRRRSFGATVRATARQAWPVAALLAVSAALTFGRAWADPVTRAKHHLLVGNADKLPAGLAVGKGLANFLWFDLKMFVTQPYSNSWNDDAGRQYFLNFTLKTSLLGDFQYDGVWLSNLGVALSVLLLVVGFTTLVGMASASKDDILEELPLSLTIAVALLSLAALRASIPMACSSDFRYVWPILMPALYLYVRGVTRLYEVGRPRLARCGEAAGWLFAPLSLAFFAVLAGR